MHLIPYLIRTLRNPNHLTLPYPHNILPVHYPNHNVPCSCTTLIIHYATQITFYRVQQSNKVYKLIWHPMHTPPKHYPIPTHATTHPTALFHATFAIPSLYRIKSNHIERQTKLWHSYALSYYWYLCIRNATSFPPSLPHEAIYHNVNTSVHNTHTHTLAYKVCIFRLYLLLSFVPFTWQIHKNISPGRTSAGPLVHPLPPPSTLPSCNAKLWKIPFVYNL